jgi:hypothetical protein
MCSVHLVPAIVIREWHSEDVADLAIEVGDAALRMIDRADHHITQTAKALGQDAQRDGLAAPRLAGDHHEAAVADGGLDASGEAVDLRHRVHALDRDVRQERMKLQTEELQQLPIHDSFSSLAAVGSGTYAGGNPVAA